MHGCLPLSLPPSLPPSLASSLSCIPPCLPPSLPLLPAALCLTHHTHLLHIPFPTPLLHPPLTNYHFNSAYPTQAIKTRTTACFDIYDFAGSDTIQIVPTLPSLK